MVVIRYQTVANTNTTLKFEGGIFIPKFKDEKLPKIFLAEKI